MSAGHSSADLDGSRPLLRRELYTWLLLLAVYVGLTSIDWAGRHATAVTNSRWLFNLERAMHIDVELALNTWLVPRGALRTFANYEYAITYLVSSFALLIWLYFRQPAT